MQVAKILLVRKERRFSIYLIDEVLAGTLIKAYIQPTRPAWSKPVVKPCRPCPSSAKSPGLTLTLEEGEDVSLPDGSLHISDQSSVDGALEVHLHLGDATSRAYKRANSG